MAAAASALRTMPSVCRVEQHATPDTGTILCASCSCRRDDLLLSIPLASCITSKDVSPAVAARLPPGDTFGRLLLALLELTSARASVSAAAPAAAALSAPSTAPASEPADSRAAYFEVVCPPSSFNVHILNWSVGGSATQCASNSVAWRRAVALRAELKEQHASLGELREFGLDVSLERYVWATLVLQTRAIVHPHAGVLHGASRWDLGGIARGARFQSSDERKDIGFRWSDLDGRIPMVGSR